MKAVVYNKYGLPDVLQLKDVPAPVPGDNDVLIRIHASTVTAGDAEMRAFKIDPLIWLPLRLFMGIRRPRVNILGQEFSGVIESIGKNVIRFREGDVVFGPSDMNLGTYAQYKCLPENYPLALKPANITFEEAACIPTGGLNALYFIRKANIQHGQKVLINGAGGSIGTIAVQLAKAKGAEVTAVDSGGKLDMLRSLGADHVIDFTLQEFYKLPEKYDVILDVFGKRFPYKGIRALKPGGCYLMANMSITILIGVLLTKFSKRRLVTGLANYKTEDLLHLKKLFEKGMLKSVIDKKYPLERLEEAHRYVDTGKKAGNVIITID